MRIDRSFSPPDHDAVERMMEIDRPVSDLSLPRIPRRVGALQYNLTYNTGLFSLCSSAPKAFRPKGKVLGFGRTHGSEV